MNSKKRRKVIAAAGLLASLGSLPLACRHGFDVWTLVGIAVGAAVGVLILIARRCI